MRREAVTVGVMLQPPLHCMGAGFMVVGPMVVLGMVVMVVVVVGASAKTLKELSPRYGRGATGNNCLSVLSRT